MDSKILMESGTNELEVLEFVVAGNSYGINVAKVKEIIQYQEVTAVPIRILRLKVYSCREIR